MILSGCLRAHTNMITLVQKLARLDSFVYITDEIAINTQRPLFAGGEKHIWSTYRYKYKKSIRASWYVWDSRAIYGVRRATAGRRTNSLCDMHRNPFLFMLLLSSASAMRNFASHLIENRDSAAGRHFCAHQFIAHLVADGTRFGAPERGQMQRPSIPIESMCTEATETRESQKRIAAGKGSSKKKFKTAMSVVICECWLGMLVAAFENIWNPIKSK